MADTPTPKQEPPSVREADQAPIHRISSRALFDGAREVIIDHDGRLYRMRITQNGKLILTA